MKIIGNTNKLPWQENKGDNIVWRYENNPIIKRNPVKGVSRIFNSCVVPWEDGFYGVFRGEKINGIPELYFGKSDNGLDWEFDEKPILIKDQNGLTVTYKYSYDPRVVKVEDTYYLIWCTDNAGATLGMAKTKDFIEFTSLENPFLPFNRNGVIFPRKVNEEYLMLSRPSDSGHTPFGDIFLSHSKDLTYWGKHKHVMGKTDEWWQNVKIGAGPAPIETDEGWLLIYHGVTNTCNGFVYSMGGAILDLDDPSKVLYRSENLLLTPEYAYEEVGFVSNVIFPCACLVEDSGKMCIYYGAADTYVAIAFTKVQELMDYIKKTSR